MQGRCSLFIPFGVAAEDGSNWVSQSEEIDWCAFGVQGLLETRQSFFIHFHLVLSYCLRASAFVTRPFDLSFSKHGVQFFHFSFSCPVRIFAPYGAVFFCWINRRSKGSNTFLRCLSPISDKVSLVFVRVLGVVDVCAC